MNRIDIENALLDRHDLHPNAKLVGWVIARYHNTKSGESFPSETTIAEQTGLSEKTVRKYTNDLISSGVMRNRSAKGLNRVYSFLLEGLITDHVNEIRSRDISNRLKPTAKDDPRATKRGNYENATPVNEGSTPVIQGSTPVNEGCDPGKSGMPTPVNEGNTPVNQGGTPVNQGDSNYSRTKVGTKVSELFPEEDQGESIVKLKSSIKIRDNKPITLNWLKTKRPGFEDSDLLDFAYGKLVEWDANDRKGYNRKPCTPFEALTNALKVKSTRNGEWDELNDFVNSKAKPKLKGNNSFIEKYRVD